MLQRKEESIAQLNRTKILSAAEKEFSLNGFKGTRVQKIADRAGLPKTNVLYYFKTKQGLYLALLEQILSMWNGQFDLASSEDDPALVLSRYICDKMEISRKRPDASKVFALEIINRAPNLSEFFKREHCSWMKGRVAVIDGWIAQGKITPQDPYALLFHIWAMTQHYADFSSQINELRGKKMTKLDYQKATHQVIALVLAGCGLSVPAEYQCS